MPNDELIQALINRNGQMAAPEPVSPPSSPSHVQIPRTHGKDINNALMPSNSDGPLGRLLGMAGILGVGAPVSVIDALLDQYKPVMKAQDVNLPQEPGTQYDPRLLAAQGLK